MLCTYHIILYEHDQENQKTTIRMNGEVEEEEKPYVVAVRLASQSVCIAHTYARAHTHERMKKFLSLNLG